MEIHIGTDEEQKVFAYHMVRQTLAICAIALEQGIELTPEVLRKSEISLQRETGSDVLKITFPPSNEDWRDFDYTGGRKL